MAQDLPGLLTLLAHTQSLTHKGILLVGPRGSGKSKLLWALQAETQYPLLNVSLLLSERLTPLRPTQRSTAVDDLFGQLLEEAAPQERPILLDNIELLFDRSLQIDPHRLVSLASRNRPLVASWPGAYSGGLLTYAYRGHQEYREWSRIDLQAISLGG